MKVGLRAVGLYAPGLPDWDASVPVLRGDTNWQTSALPAVTIPLPPAERRRTSASARAAWAVAEQALTRADMAANDVNTVFVSSGGDGIILHQLCAALVLPEHAVSPTHFHNSVHNAPAGYYGIASRSHAPSTSLGAHPAPFAAGLLDAAVQVCAESCPLLLVGYDLTAPFPLAPIWPAQQDFAMALLLTPASSDAWQLDIGLQPRTAAPPSRAAFPWQAQMAAANPMADSLLLLQACAAQCNATLTLAYLDDLSLAIALTCA
jgi:hypothetical protein